ncbi:subtilase family protein [Anaerobacterium chartisolvens]|uniref:Subtilase family protein n=1 Tax=Anaerobacterium chartisolvens TaxID=1297424 RepID=A0A369B2B0_9FIRM|nr:S8 family serine peptidase [Anaerobacterium chartisolvens]RCX15475.1 subtilase family protein [Anaerobacterium chartisolvens]
MIAVAVLDDGINEGLYNIGHLKYTMEITPTLEFVERTGYDRYLPSHGTTCGAIIKKYSPDAEIVSIKVLNDKGRGVRDQLVTALLWCADNDIKLVNLSLGTTDFRDYEEVRKAVDYADQKGVIIVAACNNKNVYTYPASLSNVIGVKGDSEEQLKEGQYRHNPYPLDGIEITSCSSHLIVKYDGTVKTTSCCNSFAAPMITAIVYNILLKNPSLSLEEVKNRIEEGAVNILPHTYSSNICKDINWVENALLFDINCANNSKMHIPYKFTVKKTVPIECTDKEGAIEQVNEYIKKSKTVLSKVDTIAVIIHDSNTTVDNVGLFELVNTMESMGKNLVYLYENSQDWNIFKDISRRRIKIFHPSVYGSLTGGETAFIEVPIIAVYDFDGKEFLNCISKLQEVFRINDYNAIAVSDSYLGIAAGVEYICLNEEKHISLEHINRVYNPDIILLGISGTDKKYDYLKRLEEKYEVDINVVILSEKSSISENIANLDTEGKIILITSRGSRENTAYKIVDSSQEYYIEVLYKYIIEMFSEEESLIT